MAIILQATLKRLSRDVKGTSVAIQGFGNVGSFAARILHDMGARVIAVSDVSGGIQRPEGIDIAALQSHITAGGKLSDYPGTSPITNAELLALPADVLIPAALGGVLTQENAAAVRAGIIIEAANAPTTPRRMRSSRGRG